MASGSTGASLPHTRTEIEALARVAHLPDGNVIVGHCWRCANRPRRGAICKIAGDRRIVAACGVGGPSRPPHAEEHAAVRAGALVPAARCGSLICCRHESCNCRPRKDGEGAVLHNKESTNQEWHGPARLLTEKPVETADVAGALSTLGAFMLSHPVIVSSSRRGTVAARDAALAVDVLRLLCPVPGRDGGRQQRLQPELQACSAYQVAHNSSILECQRRTMPLPLRLAVQSPSELHLIWP